MKKQVIIGSSHLTKKHNPLIDILQSELSQSNIIDCTISALGIDTYFLRIFNILENLDTASNFLIEIPTTGRYVEFVNEDRYNSYDSITDNNFWNDEDIYQRFINYYSKTQELHSSILTKKETQLLQQVKVLANDKLENEDNIAKGITMDAYIKKHGHTVQWISVNYNNWDYWDFFKERVDIIFDTPLYEYYANTIDLKYNDIKFKAPWFPDGSHLKYDNWKNIIYNIILPNLNK